MLLFPQKTELVLYTASPVPVSLRWAPVPLVPCPPEMRRPPLMVFIAVVVTLAMLKALLVVSVACFPFKAVMIFVPATVSDPAIEALPYTVRVEFSVAAPSLCNSREATTSRPKRRRLW